MKILNLYACLGGNRYKWNEVKNDIEVTAVELDPECAKLYQERFPKDNVIVADAHQYLLDHYKEFDFIWSSPPCPTHSKLAIAMKNQDNYKKKYPDMKLYEEILFLKHYYNGKFVVENVIPFYEPLILGHKRGRHIYWTNFNLPNVFGRKNVDNFSKTDVESLSAFHDFDFKKYQGKQNRGKMARNLVDYEAGKTIFETMLGILKKQNIKQTELF
jgi:DNA (cytosine-5)-methyltransferase 1